MRYIVNSQFALSRSPEGPLADQIVSFAQFLSEQGYGLCSMRNQVLARSGVVADGSDKMRSQ